MQTQSNPRLDEHDRFPQSLKEECNCISKHQDDSNKGKYNNKVWKNWFDQLFEYCMF